MTVGRSPSKPEFVFRHSEFFVETRGFCDMKNISGEIQTAVDQAGLSEGLASVFVPGSTAGLTAIEYEGGALQDLKEAIERMAPEGLPYKHDARWGDGNGFAHVRAALMGPSLSVPVTGGKLNLGTWQQVLLVDFDNRSRKRKVVVTLIGSGEDYDRATGGRKP